MLPARKPALAWIPSALFLSLPANAETIERSAAMIVQETSVTTVGIGLPFPSSAGDETTRQYSGTFSTSFTFDSETLEVTGFKFNGGEILLTAYGLQFQDFVTYPPPYNSRSTIVTQIPLDNTPAFGVTRLSPETRENNDGQVEFGDVDSEGALRNLDHKYFADQGAYQTWHAITGGAQDVRIDNYFPGVDLFYRGNSTVEIREASRTIHEVFARTFLTIELDERVRSTLNGNNASLSLDIVETEEGTINANTGQFRFPTNYGAWAIENGLNKPDPEDTNDAGIAYGILFALDLPADATSLPISIATTETGPITKIILPEGGLNNPMSVEYTDDLSVSDWPALPTTYYLDGADSLDLGATGEPTFGFPPGMIGFVRFTTDLE